MTGIVLTAAQLNALNYASASMYNRSSGVNSDQGWEAKRDAGLGIKTTVPPVEGPQLVTDSVVPMATCPNWLPVKEVDVPETVHSPVKETDPLHLDYVAKETDPKGLSPHTPGAKLDAGKNRLGLVVADFANAIQQVGLVATMGALKYTASGWLAVKDGKERYSDALFRHLVAHAAGERLDGSGLLHLAHAAWNVLAVLELELRTPTAEQRLERK